MAKEHTCWDICFIGLRDCNIIVLLSITCCPTVIGAPGVASFPWPFAGVGAGDWSLEAIIVTGLFYDYGYECCCECRLQSTLGLLYIRGEENVAWVVVLVPRWHARMLMWLRPVKLYCHLELEGQQMTRFLARFQETRKTAWIDFTLHNAEIFMKYQQLTCLSRIPYRIIV